MFCSYQDCSNVVFLFRPTKPDKNSEELLTADRQVELYKDVLEKISKKFSPSLSGGGADQQDPAAREKRCKKVHEYRLAQAMEESLKDLPDGLLRTVLDNCGKYFDWKSLNYRYLIKYVRQKQQHLRRTLRQISSTTSVA